MSNQYKIGIDPGLSGAMVMLNNEKVIEYTMMPVQPKQHGKGLQIDAAEIAAILKGWQEKNPTVYIERVGARPGQGVTSMFGFGRSIGVVEGICSTLNLPVHWVLPTRWKRDAGILKEHKDAARTITAEQHPEIAHALKTKTSIGIADAVLIAKYGERNKGD